MHPEAGAPALDLVRASQFLPDALAHNAATHQRMRTFAAILAGLAAGVLGLTGAAGFAFFAAAGLASSALIARLMCPGGAAGAAFPAPASDLFGLGALSTGVLTFAMAWMVAYDAIYVFSSPGFSPSAAAPGVVAVARRYGGAVQH